MASRCCGGGLLRKAAKAAAPPPMYLRSPSSSFHTITAIPREHTGCRVAARERAMGRIPALLLSRGGGGSEVPPKQFLTTEAKQIKHLFKEHPFFCTTVCRLQVCAGPGSSIVLGSEDVLPIKVHKDEETGEILNMVFARAEKGSMLKVNVPLVFKGESSCPGLKKGGYLHKIRNSLKYLCPAEHIPPSIEVDLSSLDIGDKVFMHDVDVGPSLSLLHKDDGVPICTILFAMPASCDHEAEAPTPSVAA